MFKIKFFYKTTLNHQIHKQNHQESQTFSKTENSNTSNNVGHLFGGPIFLWY